MSGYKHISLRPVRHPGRVRCSWTTGPQPHNLLCFHPQPDLHQACSICGPAQHEPMVDFARECAHQVSTPHLHFTLEYIMRMHSGFLGPHTPANALMQTALRMADVVTMQHLTHCYPFWVHALPARKTLVNGVDGAMQHSDRDDDRLCVRARPEGTQEATAACRLLHSHRQANDECNLCSTCNVLGHGLASNPSISCLKDRRGW